MFPDLDSQPAVERNTRQGEHLRGQVNLSPTEPPLTLDELPQEDGYGHYHESASGFAFLQLVKDRLASLPSMSLDFSDYPSPVPEGRLGILPPKSIAYVLL
ncbi:hypothetical protein BDW69DRAFT_183538 [Aspergillus filifer]